MGLPNASLVLHCCCAPCSCAIIEHLLEKQVSFVLFFYNPNIHPRSEYEIRKGELQRYAGRRGVPFTEAPYDPDAWATGIRGLESEPERGRRCVQCFLLRLFKTAEYAHTSGIPSISTTLSISRWKDHSQIAQAGQRAAAAFPDITYLNDNWRTPSILLRMAQISRDEALYRQTYCGCSFSQSQRNRRALTGEPGRA